jgi:protoheme IX farnesyltransferase
MAIGFLLGSLSGSVAVAGGWTLSWGHFVAALIGTWAVASGTAAMNMVFERDYDALMRRTASRPIPSGRLTASQGVFFALSLLAAGYAVLFLGVNTTTGWVSVATSVIYLFAYTPMKRVTYANVFLGAIPGALPAIGGWAAASGTILDYGAWMLFWIMFFWQVPHVMAIAWIYQKDYAHAGFQMLPKSDSQGLKASFWVVFSLLALFPNIVKLWVLDLGSWVFLIGGITLAIGYLLSGLNFAWKRDESSARALMIFSFIYLPGTWLVLGLDRFILYLQTVFG